MPCTLPIEWLVAVHTIVVTAPGCVPEMDMGGIVDAGVDGAEEDASWEDDAGAGGLREIECGPYESEVPGPVCASRGRTTAAFGFVTAGPAGGGVWCVPEMGGPVATGSDAEISMEHHVIVEGMDPWAAYECAYAVTAGAGAGTESWAAWIEAPAMAEGPIVTEVLLNPAGDEPEQEFVEVLNPGPAPIDLGLYRISDSDPSLAAVPSSLGDAIPIGSILQPGAVAIIVAAGYVPGGADPAPVAGCLIVRLDGSIGSSGLRNEGGEPVFLFAADGGAIASLYPNALGTTAQGSSATKVAASLPDGDPLSWIEADPTPGSAP